MWHGITKEPNALKVAHNIARLSRQIVGPRKHLELGAGGGGEWRIKRERKTY